MNTEPAAPHLRPHHAVREQARRGIRVTLAAILVSSFLAGLKILAGVIGHSYALIADGVESMMDIVASIIAWGSLRIAAIPPDSNHPFGHGKAEPLGALVVATAMLVAAAAIAFQSVHEILTPHHAPEPFTLFVLVGVVITKEVLFRHLHRVGRATGSTVVTTDAWHHRSDALTSAAAFLGISIALVAGEGYESADDWAALFACAVIAVNGARFFRGALDEVMDAAVAPEVEDRIRALGEAVDDVVRVEKCRVRKSGFALFAEVHVEVDGDISVRRGHEVAHQVKDALLRSVPGLIDAVVHVEPTDGETADG